MVRKDAAFTLSLATRMLAWTLIDVDFGQHPGANTSGDWDRDGGQDAALNRREQACVYTLDQASLGHVLDRHLMRQPAVIAAEFPGHRSGRLHLDSISASERAENATLGR